MDHHAPQFSLLALIAAAIAGFVVGRLTAGRNDPRALEAKRREAQRYEQGIRALASKLPPATSSKVRNHLAKGESISAIKLVREETGCGLKEAKDAVEHMTGGRKI